MDIKARTAKQIGEALRRIRKRKSMNRKASALAPICVLPPYRHWKMAMLEPSCAQ